MSSDTLAGDNDRETCVVGGCFRDVEDAVDLGRGPKPLCRACKSAYLAGYNHGTNHSVEPDTDHTEGDDAE